MVQNSKGKHQWDGQKVKLAWHYHMNRNFPLVVVVSMVLPKLQKVVAGHNP
jgi:hypothetical protein